MAVSVNWNVICELCSGCFEFIVISVNWNGICIFLFLLMVLLLFVLLLDGQQHVFPLFQNVYELFRCLAEVC
jgi:hypothetical protein